MLDLTIKCVTGQQTSKILASADASGHICSAVPGIIGCSGSFNIIPPHSGDPVGANQTLACVQVATKSLRMSHSYLETLCFSETADGSPLLPLDAQIPEGSGQRWATKPQQPTSTGRHLMLHSACWQWLTSPIYLAPVKGFFQELTSWESQSSSTTCLVVSDTRTLGPIQNSEYAQICA